MAASPAPAAEEAAVTPEAAAKPKRRRARSRRTNGAAGRREAEATPVPATDEGEAEPSKRRRPRTVATAARAVEAAATPDSADESVAHFRAPADHGPATAPTGSVTGQAAIASEIGTTTPIVGKSPRKAPVTVEIQPDAPLAANEDDSDRPPRKGWWNRILS